MARSKKTGESYKLNMLDQGGVSLGILAAGGQRLETLGRHIFPQPLAAGDLVTLELRAQGDRLTGLVNGVAVIEARDTRYPEAGTWGIVADDGWFEMAEFQPLSTSASAVTTALEPDAIRLFDQPAAVAGNDAAKLQDGVLILGGDRGGKVTYRKTLSRDVILRASVRMTSDLKNFGLRIREGPQTADSFYLLGPETGLKAVALYYVENNQLKRLKSWPLPRIYEASDWLPLEIHATGDELTAYADGQKLGTVRDSQLLQPGGVGLFASYAEVRDVIYVPLDKPGTNTGSAPASVSAQAEPWRDWIAEKRAEKRLASLGFEDDGTYIQKRGAVGGPSWKPTMRDGAIRVTWKLTGEIGPAGQREPSITLRHGGQATPPQPGVYVLHFARSGLRIDLYLVDASGQAERLELKTWPLPPGFDRTQEHTLEFRTVGDELSVRLNGQIIGTHRDTRATEGGFGFFPADGALIRKAEYLRLDPPGTGAPSASAAEPWRDWLVEARDKTFFANLFAESGDHVTLKRSAGMSWEYALKARDMAVRATWKPVDVPPLIPEVQVRQSAGRHYAARVAGGRVQLSERQQATGTVNMRTIQEWPLPAGFDGKAEMVLELRAVGDLLTVRLNGRDIGSARDGALKESGTTGAFATEGTAIRKLEYLNLDRVAVAQVAVAPQAAAEKWQDLLAAGGWRSPFTIENGVLTRPVNTMANRKWKEEIRDCAWRVTRRWDGGWYDLQLGLRSNANKGVRLQFDQLRQPDRIVALITADDKRTFASGNASGQTKKRFSKGDLITIEFRAVGTRITASIDGEVIASVEDRESTAGGYEFWCNYGDPPAFHKVEFLNLDGATTASPDGWVSLLAGADVTRGSLMAPWTLENGVLRSPQRSVANEDDGPGSHQVFVFPLKNPARRYDLRYRITRNARGFAIVFPFVRDGGFGDLRIDGGHGVGLVPAGKRKERRERQYLPPGEQHEVLIEVREDSIRVSLDGAVEFEHAGPLPEGRQRDAFYPEGRAGEPFFGLGVCGGDITVHSAEYRPVE